MHLPAWPWLHPPQLPHRPQYPLPNRVAAQVALIEHRIGPHGGMDRRVLAVALYEGLGGPPSCSASSLIPLFLAVAAVEGRAMVREAQSP